MTIRTLPLRVAPISGESLDSWVDAIAHRARTPLGPVRVALGLSRSARPSWLLRLNDEEAETLAYATGIERIAIDDMVMSRYDGTALEIDTHDGLTRSFPFGGPWRSRYCPKCLAETSGRWQLSWRLAWSFACTRHRCLLADRCPRCAKAQRQHVHHFGHVPQPGRCALPGRERGSRCGADLTIVEVQTMSAGHPVILAQRIIWDVIADDGAAFGVYAAEPRTARAVLADVKSLAVRVLTHATRHGPAMIQPEELADLYASHDAQRTVRWRYRRNGAHHPPHSAGDAAVAITAAVWILRAPTITEAGNRARWLVPAAAGRSTPLGLSSSARDGPISAAVIIKSYHPRLGPHRQLRYRSALRVPRPPDLQQRPPAQLVARLPACLWPSWTAHLALPGNILCYLPPALSCGVLLVGTRTTGHVAAAALGKAIDGAAVNNTLHALHRDPQWEAICAAITRLSDYLTVHRPPIDYRGRRELDYSSLLPAERWHEICSQSSAASATTANDTVARAFLFELVSGSPAQDTDWFPSARRAVYGKAAGDFLFGLTSQLMTLLRREAKRFLAARRIHEPITWSPPLELVSDLALPNPDTFGIEVLHRHVIETNDTIGRVARKLNLSVHAVRYLLEQHPAELAGPLSRQSKRYVLRTAKLRDALNREAFQQLYVDEGLNLVEIADRFGATKEIVRHLAHTYQLPLRPTYQAPEPNWLERQLFEERRTRTDIAAELGCHPDTVTACVKKYGLTEAPDEPPCAGVPMSLEEANELLAPALTRAKTRRCLKRFARATDYPSMGAAAHHLGIEVSTLCIDIKALESTYGERLLIRSQHPLPMKPTSLGARIVAAYRRVD